MKRITFIFIQICLFSLFTIKPIFAESLIAGTSAVIKIDEIEEDTRIKKLEQFLEIYNSPLSEYAEVFIKKADEYGLPDWKLVPAITGVESTFGKAIPYNSYNAYGWANGAYSFESWEESIDVVTKALAQKYYGRGADTVEKIAKIYAPPSTTWAFKVNYFMDKIENFVPLKSFQLSMSI